MLPFRFASVALLAGLVQACTMAAPPPDGGAERSDYLLASALYGDPVFDNDVRSFARSYGAATSGLADQTLFGWGDKGVTRHDGTHEAELTRLAGLAKDGVDVVTVMYTSHGGPGVMVIKPPSAARPTAGLNAKAFADLFEPLENDLQIVILQACYSGSLIDGLKHPNRIIMTAAAADRPSFGCRPNNDNTWFIESLNAAMSQGGTWKQVFERTRQIVSDKETANGITADGRSNPQSYVGRNAQDVWNAPI